MKREELLMKVNKIFIHTLENEDILLNETTTAEDIYEWDSLTHVMLAVTIEKYFTIQFTSIEIQNWKNVGEILDCIDSKL